jgi:menaquinone-specific isochorismate synthase
MTQQHALAPASGAQLVARSRRIDDPAPLLTHLDPEGFAWLHGDSGFVTTGIAALVRPEEARAFLASIAHITDEDAPAAGPRAVGALPFADDASLVVPARIVGRDADGTGWETMIGHAEMPAAIRVTMAPSRFAVTARTTRETWRAMVEDALNRIRRGALEKVVLARTVTIDTDQPIDVHAVLAELHRSQPGSTVYADRGLVGASPELLVHKRGLDVLSRPLAGTATTRDAIARSEKDQREHALVVRAVVDALHGLADDVAADDPSPRAYGDLVHLSTTVTARAGDASDVVAFVRALHPTPAVAGTPTAAACAALAEIEPAPRGRYAGPCGWIDARGDGDFIVALRGGEIDGCVAMLYAGAGVVEGSDPDREWVETQRKFMPMLQAVVRP